MRTLFAVLAAFFYTAAHSLTIDPEQLRKALEATPMNTFRFIGNALVCKSDKADPEGMYYACLHIGQMQVGDSYRPIREGNSKPYKEIAGANGITQSVYLVIAQKETKAYWVIGHRDDKIGSIQLTGNYSSPNLSFSTIQLNDTEEKVKEVLGPRYRVSEVKEIGGVVWDYFPFPITIELVNQKVYSIRVSIPNNTLQPSPQSGPAER